jgi:hypothetical protein
MEENDRHMIRVMDFSEYPGGRHSSDGPDSGEKFREEVLSPALSVHDRVVIDFTGVFLAAPSFIDEAIGPFMEELGRQEFDRRILIRAEDDPDLFEDLTIIGKRRFRF